MCSNMLLGGTWHSSIGFQKQWLQAMQWKDHDGSEDCCKIAIFMSNVGTIFNSFLLNILLIAFDIRTHQFLRAILAAAILCGFYAVSLLAKNISS